MSINTLATRSAGQVIQAAFFNDLKLLLGGEFVGRNAGGVPTAGQSLGTIAYPWGPAYVDQLIVGGVAFSPDTLERPPYQVVSGKTRSGSNQPAFLVPAGGAPTFNLLASAVNLVLSINGVSSVWAVDVNSIPVTAAPSTNNTCLVNDATAGGQVESKTWGEYGSGAPYYAIAVDTMLSNVSARVGSIQAFKHGTEYFVAYIESTTSLSRCFRGFFFDSSVNPVKRTALTDNDTITLMNLGWVFADQDGATVDTIFTGAGVNNNPTYSFSAPSSPLTGDYWYDMGNGVWKRYDGASFVIANRILVGLVVADSTNCVAARSFGFFGLCRIDNTVEPIFRNVALIGDQTVGSRINVNGSLVDFGTTSTGWSASSSLATSTDRYNAAVTANIVEYAYISDGGQALLSDMEPYWRADLLGWYHPFNPWRCVALAQTDGSANFTTGGVYRFSLYPSLGPLRFNASQAAAFAGALAVAGNVTLTGALIASGVSTSSVGGGFSVAQAITIGAALGGSPPTLFRVTTSGKEGIATTIVSRFYPAGSGGSAIGGVSASALGIFDVGDNTTLPIVVGTDNSIGGKGFRVIRGAVTSGGARGAGEGFEVTPGGTGVYNIAFDVAFDAGDSPLLVAACQNAGQTARTLSTSGTGALVHVSDCNGTYSNANGPFQFICVGVRA